MRTPIDMQPNLDDWEQLYEVQGLTKRVHASVKLFFTASHFIACSFLGES
jgi:hypothetical protein